MVVDMRMRPPIPSLRQSVLFQPGGVEQTRHPDYPRAESASQASLPLLLKEMDEAGIQYGVVMGRQSLPPFGTIANAEIRELLVHYPGRFLAWAGLDLRQSPDQWLAEIDTCFEHPGFRGVSIEPAISLHPDITDANDERLYPIYEECLRRDVPVNITLSGVLQKIANRPYGLSNPLQIHQLASAFPELDIHVAHAGYPWVMEMVGVAFTCRNVWLSPDLYMAPEIPASTEYAKLANGYLPDRTVFGSNYPSKPFGPMLRAYRSWDWRPGVIEKVLSHNALRLMRLA